MCTQEEVRTVVKEAVTPIWMRNVFVTGVVLLSGWLLYNSHNQDVHMQSIRADIASEMSIVRLSTATQNATMIGQIERLTLQIKNLKEIAIDRSRDRYTGREARSRNKLIDERCAEMRKNMEHINDTIEKYHKM